MPEKTVLRQHMRSRRLALNSLEQQQAALELLKVVANSALFQNSQRIAFYLANAGEIDPSRLVEAAWKMGKSCYLPILASNGDNQLLFAPFTEKSVLVENRYGIAEPRHTPEQLCPAPALELVFVPLVAVDLKGNRLGMGKGYYDRTFAFLCAGDRPSKPQLIGLAHSFQQTDRIDPSSWDVPLQGVATESTLTMFS